MGHRPNVDGVGMALSGDKTTTGAQCLSSVPLSQVNIYGFGVIRRLDKTTPCQKCGKQGVINDAAAEKRSFMWLNAVVDRCVVSCGCPPGTNRVIASLGQWRGRGPSLAQQAMEKRQAMLGAEQAVQEAKVKRLAEVRECRRVFAKSCLRGDGCNDAGEAQEPQTNVGEMCFFRAQPVTDPATDEEVPQHAHSAKKTGRHIEA